METEPGGLTHLGFDVTLLAFHRADGTRHGVGYWYSFVGQPIRMWRISVPPEVNTVHQEASFCSTA